MRSIGAYAMGGSKTAIMVGLFKLFEKGGKPFVEPSIGDIIKRLNTFQKISIKDSWAYECLKYLSDIGFLIIKKRPVQMPDGTFKSRISMYYFTKKGCNFLVNHGITAARALRQRIQAWLDGDDERYPGASSDQKDPTPDEAKSFIDRIGDVTKKFNFFS